MRGDESELHGPLDRPPRARGRHVPGQVLVRQEQPPGRAPGDLQQQHLHLQDPPHSTGNI